MIPIHIMEIVSAVNGEVICGEDNTNKYIKNVCTDTRNVTGDNILFIPLRGDNFDGHNYIDSAFENGVICSLSEVPFIHHNNEVVILVEDTKKALADLARYYIGKFEDIPVIAITGSVGKTTTKDIVASVLEQKFNTLKTQGNFNNEIGLPLTIFNIDRDTEIVVLEMGMNNFGEIQKLSSIVNPDIAIITNVGFSHIENLGSREGILKAKCEIFDFLRPTGFGILNGDDDMLVTIKDNEKYKDFIYFGLENNGINKFFVTDINENGLEGISFRMNTNDDDDFLINVNSPGKHMIYNALVATIIGKCFRIPKEDIKLGIESFKTGKMRSNIIKTDKYTIIDDVYNASPSSMMAGVDILKNCDGRKVAILGDMFELGNYSEQFHSEVGRYVANNKVDVLIAVGELSKYTQIGAQKENNPNLKILYFQSQNALLDEVDKILCDGDYILIKASRGMKLEKTIDKIKR